MLPDRVSNPGPLTYESDALPTALRGPATLIQTDGNVIQGITSCKKNCMTTGVITLWLEDVLAGDQWWPRTSGGRLRFAHAITHLLRHRFGHFVNSNKWNTHKKDWLNFLPGSQQINNFTNLPSCKHHCISGGWQPFKHAWLITEINIYNCCIDIFLSRKAINCNQCANKSI